MNQNKIIQYLDGVITAFCEWYLYRFHIVPLMPGYRLRKRFKRIGFFMAGGAKDADGQVADMDRYPTLYIDPNSPHTNNDVFSRWLVREHVKAITDPDEVETINIVFDNPIAK